MSLYVPYQMETLHSSFAFPPPQVGVHILCLLGLNYAGNFPLMWLEKREEGGSL